MHLKPDFSQDDAPNDAERGCASQVIVIITGSNYLTLEVPEEKGEPVFQESISHKLYNGVYIHVHITCHYKYRPSG